MSPLLCKFIEVSIRKKSRGSAQRDSVCICFAEIKIRLGYGFIELLSGKDVVQNRVAGLAGSARGLDEDNVYAVPRGGLEFDFAPGLGEGAGDSYAAQLRHNAGQDMAQGFIGFLQAFDFGLQSDVFLTDAEVFGQKEVMVEHGNSPLQFICR